MHDPFEPTHAEMQDDEGTARSTARLLRARGQTDLFVFLAVTAAEGRWGSFAAALSEVADISADGVTVLLEEPRVSLGWNHLYDAAGLPRSLFKFFIRLLAIARDISGDTELDERRARILTAAQTTAEAKEAPVPATLWNALSLH